MTNQFLPQYNSFEHFVEVHNVSEIQISQCFGPNYFTQNAHYDNCKVINKLAKYLGMNIKVQTIYPGFDSVAFKVYHINN